MNLDPTITIGNILEITTIAAGGIIAIGALKGTISNLKSQIVGMKSDFTDMKSEIKKLGDVIIKLAVTDQRLLAVEQDVREMRHGRGFIQKEVQGEWPRT